MKHFRYLLFASILSTFLYGCMTVPVSGRKAFNFIPESLEISLGAQSYSSMLGKEKISNDQRLNEMIKRVGQRIAAVSGRSDYQWEFKVIDSDVQNAFCLPGGKIAIYRGILPIAKNEAGLATVMSHEITHAIARHGGQRISAQLALMGGMVALSQTALKDNKNSVYIMAALGLGSHLGVMLPYGRMQESEADEVGQILMARAGYDPSESVKFWARFAEVTKGHNVPTLLSDHPSSSSRSANLQERLPAAQKVYSQASQKYGLGENF